MRGTSLFIAAALTALVPASLRAAEGQTEQRFRDALRASQAQVNALEDERARLKAANEAQKKELDSLRAELASAKRKARARESTPAPDLTLRLAEEAEANRKLGESLAQSQAATREVAEKCRSTDEQRTRLAAEVSSLASRVSSCEKKRARLYGLTYELLERYQNRDAADVVAWLDPLLGFKRVEAENFSQELEDKLLEQKVKP